MPAFTPNAIRLAALYFPILVGRAKREQVMTSGELAAAVKARHPNSGEIAAALSTPSGVKLDFIAAFCQKYKLPDLSSLVVNDAPGSGDHDAEKHSATEAQLQAFAYDWDEKLTVFDAYVIDETKHDTNYETSYEKTSGSKSGAKGATKSVTKRAPKSDASGAVLPKKRKEDEAGAVLYAYYSAHKTELPADITKHKPALMALLMEGRDAVDAFNTVVASL